MKNGVARGSYRYRACHSYRYGTASPPLDIRFYNTRLSRYLFGRTAVFDSHCPRPVPSASVSYMAHHEWQMYSHLLCACRAYSNFPPMGFQKTPTGSVCVLWVARCKGHPAGNSICVLHMLRDRSRRAYPDNRKGSPALALCINQPTICCHGLAQRSSWLSTLSGVLETNIIGWRQLLVGYQEMGVAIL